ncbi:hypothetical protein D3C81_1542590 [compost metagenome]
MFCLFGVTLGSKGLAAAQVVLVFREHHLIAGFFQQGAGFVEQRGLFAVGRRRAHHSRHARCQVHHPWPRIVARRAERNGLQRLRHGRRPLRNPAVTDFAEVGAEATQARGAEQPACAIGSLQGKACTTEGSVEIFCQPVGGFHMLRDLAAQFLHQLAGVDAHRAALGAQAGGGAGVDALVLVGL